MHSPATDGLQRRTTRRNFIVWYLAGLLTATVVATVAPLLVYLFPPPSANKKQNIPVNLDKPLDQLEDGQGIAFQAPKDTGFVMTDGGGDNYPGKIGFRGFVVKVGGQLIVLSATCSHLGCSVNLNLDAHRFDCPCHGSEFDLKGNVTHGPAVAPLSHYDWKQVSPTQIQVVGVSLPGIG